MAEPQLPTPEEAPNPKQVLREAAYRLSGAQRAWRTIATDKDAPRRDSRLWLAKREMNKAREDYYALAAEVLEGALITVSGQAITEQSLFDEGGRIKPSVRQFRTEEFLVVEVLEDDGEPANSPELFVECIMLPSKPEPASQFRDLPNGETEELYSIEELRYRFELNLSATWNYVRHLPQEPYLAE